MNEDMKPKRGWQHCSTSEAHLILPSSELCDHMMTLHPQLDDTSIFSDKSQNFTIFDSFVQPTAC